MPLSTVFQISKMYRCRFIGWKCTELLQETFEDSKEVIWCRDSDRKKNDQKKKEKNKQWYTKNTTQKSKYLATHPHYSNTICYVLRSMNCELGQFWSVSLLGPSLSNLFIQLKIDLYIPMIVYMKTLNTCIENGCLHVLMFLCVFLIY